MRIAVIAMQLMRLLVPRITVQCMKNHLAIILLALSIPCIVAILCSQVAVRSMFIFLIATTMEWLTKMKSSYST